MKLEINNYYGLKFSLFELNEDIEFKSINQLIIYSR